MIDEPISVPSSDAPEADAAADAATEQVAADEQAPDVATESPSDAGEELATEASGQVAESQEEAQPEEAPAADPQPEPEEAPAADLQPETEEDPAADAVEVAEPIEVAEPEPVEVAEPEPVKAPAAETRAETPAPADDPFGGPGDWYVVHTYAGYENKVKTNLESRIHTMQMEDKIFRVHIPMEDVMEIKSGKKQVVQKKVFPGYLLVKMFYDNDSWYVVRNTPGVTGFVSAGTGSKPTPLSKREIEKILVVKKQEVKPQFRLGFEEGDIVRIISGPFADFNGTINEINMDQSKLKVLVNIFDRETPVELGFDQVSKV
ncbi:MAG: transcription termination/antitermination protein NusG [Actinomycetota bacterium]|nr:transcription termination/antitermination protein NusG [Actinomycetota bacterium]